MKSMLSCSHSPSIMLSIKLEVVGYLCILRILRTFFLHADLPNDVQNILFLLNQQLRRYGTAQIPVPTLDDRPTFVYDSHQYQLRMTTCRDPSLTASPLTASNSSTRMLINFIKHLVEPIFFSYLFNDIID